MKLKRLEYFSDMRNYGGIAALRSIGNKLYVIIIIFCNIHIVYAQQGLSQDTEIDGFHRMGQDLINYLDAGKYFEAKEQYGHIKEKYDTTDVFLEDYYKLQMKYFERQFDSAVFYEQKMIDDGLFEGPVVLNLYHRRCKIYTEMQDYEKAIQICHKAKDFIDKNAYMFDDKYLQEIKNNVANEENIIRRRSLEPAIEIKRNNASNAVPILKNDTVLKNHLPIEISYNNHNNVRTAFDTGFDGYFVFDKNEAEKIGVRKWHIYDNDTTGTINGVQASGYFGIIDSLQIANIKIYNVPVGVIDNKSFYNLDTMNIESDKKEKINSYRDLMKVAMGLKAMNLIGRFVLDYENNEIYFPADDEHFEINKEKNIFLYLDRLYTRIHLNKKPLTVFIDTGGNGYLDIDENIGKKYEPFIKIDTIRNEEQRGIAMPHKIFIDTVQLQVKDPHIIFNGKRILQRNSAVNIRSSIFWNFDSNMIEDGIVGNPFIKSLGKKVLFDLRNMRLEVLKENDY